ncbi:MAG: helix-hairpin-helix domain-containing protein [Verrucomicrobia bacterium]|nr:helix-hairpin-helix domain-containing protein [Verrucomicrobiota bacterium]MDA1065159.1 helix-hairpin-helix domain-containing protein [Verrucomicrobiota bacterium]
MKLIVMLLTGVTPLLPLAGQSADPELSGKLKAVMQLFDKNQAALKEEIVELNATNSALSEANLKLYKELQDSQTRVENLEAEILILKSKFSEVAVRGLESASLISSTDQNAETAIEGNTQKNLPKKLPSVDSVPEETLVNINTATAEELAKLPTIDDDMAVQIISNRPYRSIDDLIINQGFGPMKLRRITPFITAQ